MASPLLHVSFLFTLSLAAQPLLFGTPSFARLISIKLSNDLLNQICSATKNPSFCLESLKSDPGTATADLLGLAGIDLRFASRRVADNIGVIDFLLGKTTDPEVRKRATLCVDAYDLASNEMKYADTGLKNNDYESVIAAGQGCMTHATECSTGFKAYPPFLPQENEKLYTFCQVLVDVAHRLSKR